MPGNMPTDLSRRGFMVTTALAALSSGVFWTQEGLAAGELNVRVTGAQDPTLIFVHGFACSLEDWDAQVSGLSSQFRCVVLDLPGHGSSPAPEAATIAALGSAVNVAEKQAGGRSAVLVGHSMGCRVITEAYLQAPADVAGLVFVDGSIIGGDPDIAIKRARENIERNGMDALTQRLFSDMFVESSDPKLRDRLVARAQKVDAKFREELFVDLIRWDVTKSKDALKQIKVPTLVLQSTFINSELKRMPMQAGMTTPWMDAIASLVAKSQAKIITGSGHFTMIEAAQAVTQDIQTFAVSLT
jgi:pimeloyl-ACP methyl ester carboxylesterase